jgi:hypothetical protein
LQFFDSGFQATNPRAQLDNLVVEQKRALGGIKLRAIRAGFLSPLTAMTLTRRSGRQARGGLRLAGKVPRRDFQLACEP